MFGGKKSKSAVPVLTVHTLPQPYEIIGTVVTKTNRFTGLSIMNDLIDDLSEEAEKIGADAVIGFTFSFYVHGTVQGHGAGTAIRYVNV
jgi:hypothetical protein